MAKHTGTDIFCSENNCFQIPLQYTKKRSIPDGIDLFFLFKGPRSTISVDHPLKGVLTGKLAP
jgi:hypothetical protein